MRCEIDWQNQDVALQKAENATLLQDSRYGEVLASMSAFRPRRGLVLVNGQPAGCVQIMERRALFGLIHGVMLDRGPAWFPGFGGAHHIKAFFDTFNRQFPVRFGRKRRMIPEVADGPAARKMLDSAGLIRMGDGYQTYVVDVAQSAELLRAGLHQKWRNVLNKAERESGLKVEWDGSANPLSWFIKVYEQDKIRKGYEGPSRALLEALAQQFAPSGDLFLGRVMQGDVPLCAMLIIRHGSRATYVAGWASEAGHDAGAHHLGLWEARAMVQDKGVTQFDLGGFHEQGAKGIKEFKEGMGGVTYTLAGCYA